MRIVKEVEIEGKKTRALFDTGSFHTYVASQLLEDAPCIRLRRPYRVALGGRTIEVRECCLFNGRIEGLDFSTWGIPIDTLGEVEGKTIDVIIGASTMEQWEIIPHPKDGTLDLSGLRRREFTEYLGLDVGDNGGHNGDIGQKIGFDEHLTEARDLYHKALEEFERAERGQDGVLLRDACGKGWLSAVEAADALFIKRGIKEKELPRTDRGRRYMIFKYAPRELRLLYLSLRDSLHIIGYYDGTLNFDEAKVYLDDLDLYIRKIEELEGS